MLTSDLVRVTFRKDRIYPRLLNVDDENLLKATERMISDWKRHEGRERREWDEALKDQIGDSPDFLVARGLGKLLDDRSDWAEPDSVDPQEVRRALFELSTQHFPVLPVASQIQTVDRAEVMETVARQFGVTPAEIEDAMYSDRREEQRLRKTRDIDARALLVRYNLSNTQAVLLRATELRISLKGNEPKKVRELFRYLKFHRLMHTARRGGDGQWTIKIDGPMSLFSQSQRYGLQMAMFLPALLLLTGWELEADIRWPDRNEPLLFSLDPKVGLETWKRSRGTWMTDEEKMLRERVGDGRSGWRISETAEIVPLDRGDVLIPDFVMRHKDGRSVFVEIVGYWRKAYLEARMERLRRSAPSNLVLCVSRKLAVDDEIEDAPLHFIDYAQVIPITKFMEAVKSAAPSKS